MMRVRHLSPEHTGTHRNIAKTHSKSLEYLTVFKENRIKKKNRGVSSALITCLAVPAL